MLLPDGSRMNREVPVRFCEQLAGKFRRSTHSRTFTMGHKERYQILEEANKLECETNYNSKLADLDSSLFGKKNKKVESISTQSSLLP